MVLNAMQMVYFRLLLFGCNLFGWLIDVIFLGSLMFLSSIIIICSRKLEVSEANYSSKESSLWQKIKDNRLKYLEDKNKEEEACGLQHKKGYDYNDNLQPINFGEENVVQTENSNYQNLDQLFGHNKNISIPPPITSNLHCFPKTNDPSYQVEKSEQLEQSSRNKNASITLPIKPDVNWFTSSDKALYQTLDQMAGCNKNESVRVPIAQNMNWFLKNYDPNYQTTTDLQNKQAFRDDRKKDQTSQQNKPEGPSNYKTSQHYNWETY
ncbi:unnamed protein product [Thelazia callipaeda]|uniref:Transmembrane protein n=1 Tax=Thelazia callipaeda TaxID=103827 RepID=A0A0N5CMX3_THECL|nr:unnamed protein product [Thelazia callipaeda]